MEYAKIECEEYTTDYIESLPDGERAELIDGVVYDMSSPNPIHQDIVATLTMLIKQHIIEKGGDCKVYPAPFAVYLNKDNKTYVEPDISVICDNRKIDDKGCNGAPDFIIEIISLSTKRKDYGIKSFKYRSSGVREYWIINPLSRTINVFDFEHNDENSNSYTFDDEITSCVYPDFKIRLADYV
jgi:Uma2 family endonuclease